MASPPLVVPVRLDALSVNAQLLADARTGTFRRWQFNYSALDDYKSPEPDAGDRGWPAPAPGVHLHWVLPDALRCGSRSQPGGPITYPLVPNRWLVVRLPLGGSPRGWVVESDCPYSSLVTQIGVEDTSAYLVDDTILTNWKNSPDKYRQAAYAPGTTVANIGVPFDLNGWSDRDADGSTFLTALAPANPSFPIFTPHNTGVFSFHDDMRGVSAGAVSYVVVGWYSNADDDVMGSWPADTKSKTAYADLLGRLDWQPAGKSTDRPTSSLYQGMALGVAWDPNGPPLHDDPLAGVLTSGKLDAAIGNTTVDAFTALVAKQLGTAGPGAETLLRAFQYDLLPTLNQPGGDAVLARRARNAAFGTKPGTYTWAIVGAEGRDGAPVALTTGEATWLAQLNADQATLDDAVATLHRMQWELNAVYWKRGTIGPFGQEGVSTDDLDNQLDPTWVDPKTHLPSLAARTITQIQTVTSALTRVPQPVGDASTNRSDAFAAGVAAFAQQKGLDLSAKVLKAVPSARYALANDPVIAISGVKPPGESIPGPLAVRVISDVVTSIVVDRKTVALADVASALPAVPGIGSVPAALAPAVAALLGEWFLLDHGNAAAIATAASLPEADVTKAIDTRAAPAYTQPLPDAPLDPWKQPWEPMFMEWTVQYAALPYRDAHGSVQWEFDGDDYRFTPAGAATAAETHQVRGIALLSPHAQVVLGARLCEFIQKFGPDPQLKALYDAVDQVDSWLFVTQAMSGFNERLTARDSRAYRRPGADETIGTAPAYLLARTIGYADEDSSPTPGALPLPLPGPLRGAVGSVPYLPGGIDQPFHGVRQGQLYFKSLSLYDKFGRVLEVLLPPPAGLADPKNFPLVVDADLAPGPLTDSSYAAVPQLPPRILQHARLDFPLAAAPIGGWVIVNHLDSSLLLCAPDGTALGEYRLYADATGTKSGGWQPPPHDDTIKSLADVAKRAPLVAGMIGGGLGTEAAFEAMLEAIDTTLWTTDPLGSRRDQRLTVLVGRPLALVSASLGLSLDGPPIGDTAWGATLKAAALEAPAKDILGQPFGIRLGDLATRDDGLIGYWDAGDWSTFNSVAAPESTTSQDYVVPIGSRRANGTLNFLSVVPDGAQAAVTMLVDPRGTVHATTGALPVVTATVPAPLVDAALRSIELTFRVAPALTFAGPTPVQAGADAPKLANSVVLPVPAEQNGAWSFWDQEPGWTGYGLVNPPPQAQLGPVPPTLRDGFLQLVIALEED